jgi:hypothetical protein
MGKCLPRLANARFSHLHKEASQQPRVNDRSHTNIIAWTEKQNGQCYGTGITVNSTQVLDSYHSRICREDQTRFLGGTNNPGPGDTPCSSAVIGSLGLWLASGGLGRRAFGAEGRGPPSHLSPDRTARELLSNVLLRRRRVCPGFK